MDTNPAATTHALSVTRRIPAPPEAVFAAWTQPERIRPWWGPAGMTMREAEVDLRPGGYYRTVLRDAAGSDYANNAAIEAVEAPHRLVLRVMAGSCGDLQGARCTILFEPDAAGTRLTATWQHPTAEMRAAHEAMGFAKGWGEMLDKLTASLILPPAGCPVATRAAPEHGWLHRLLGEWTYESECAGPPGEPPMRATGRERVHSLGGYWVVGESEGGMPGGGEARWTVALGYDAGAGLFRGSFIGSMMPHMFVYAGHLAEDGRTLTLDTEGPAMSGEGTARYRDILCLEDDDSRSVASEVQGPDGSWTRFMTARFRRAG